MKTIFWVTVLSASLAFIAVYGLGWQYPRGDSELGIVVASPAQVTSVVEDLGPSETLHIITIEYRSPESVGEMVADVSPCQSGWTRNEGWETFGPDGVLVASHGEARTEEGVLCGSTELRNGVVVYFDPLGNANFRTHRQADRPEVTVKTVQAGVRQAQDLAAEALAEQQGVSVALGNEQVVVLEELDGEEIHRQYILPDVNFQVKTETLQVVDGQEVLVESTHFEVYEVVSE